MTPWLKVNLIHLLDSFKSESDRKNTLLRGDGDAEENQSLGFNVPSSISGLRSITTVGLMVISPLRQIQSRDRRSLSVELPERSLGVYRMECANLPDPCCFFLIF